jgi:protein-tyrosine phosphatase
VVRDGPGHVTGYFAPSRQVQLGGAVNVRDIGGYRTSYGTAVNRGRLFRGDALNALTEPDLSVISAMGLRTVIDFRTPGEVLVSGPDRLPRGQAPVSMPVTGGDLAAVYEIIASGDHERQRRELGDGRAAALMVDINRGFVADPRQRDMFGAALRLLCIPGRLPGLYHCSGGKDRSGWMTAIILTILGVSRELVLRDYLLSNDFHRTEYQKLRYDLIKTGIIADQELIRPILEQSPTYLGAAFDEAERRYGSFAAFVNHGLETSEHTLHELRVGMLTDSDQVSALFAPPRAEPAQPHVGEQREDHREADQDAHVTQPGRWGVVPQRIGALAARF